MVIPSAGTLFSLPVVTTVAIGAIVLFLASSRKEYRPRGKRSNAKSENSVSRVFSKLQALSDIIIHWDESIALLRYYFRIKKIEKNVYGRAQVCETKHNICCDTEESKGESQGNSGSSIIVDRTQQTQFSIEDDSEVQAISLKYGSLPDYLFCYKLLQHTSRSFAAVILEIHAELRLVITVFYLILRALDTLEDDNSLDLEIKKREIRAFHTYLENLVDWDNNADDRSAGQCGFLGKKRKRYKNTHKFGLGLGIHDSNTNVYEYILLTRFDKVQNVFYSFENKYRKILYYSAKQMAEGMLLYLEVGGIRTCQEYNKYCYYVAGLVGLGLTRLFACSGLERVENDTFHHNINNEFNYGKRDRKVDSIEMGLFLQKTNITRDICEDMNQPVPRCFYPEQIYKQYVNQLTDMKNICDSDDLSQGSQVGMVSKTKALCLLNSMIANALDHIPGVMSFLSAPMEPSVFRFCAIPQVMAIATLERLFGNPDVLERQVKIRRGEAVKLIFKCESFGSVVDIFEHYLLNMKHKMNGSVLDYYDDSNVSTNGRWRNIKTGNYQQDASIFTSEDSMNEIALMKNILVEDRSISRAVDRALEAVMYWKQFRSCP